jgi:hypothetical protein
LYLFLSILPISAQRKRSAAKSTFKWIREYRYLSIWKWIVRIPRRRERCVAWKQRHGHPGSRNGGVKKEPRRHPRVCLVGTTFFSLTYGNKCPATRSFTRWQQAVLVFHNSLTFTTPFLCHLPVHQTLLKRPSHHSSLTKHTPPCLEDAMATASAARQ